MMFMGFDNKMGVLTCSAKFVINLGVCANVVAAEPASRAAMSRAMAFLLMLLIPKAIITSRSITKHNQHLPLFLECTNSILNSFDFFVVIMSEFGLFSIV